MNNNVVFVDQLAGANPKNIKVEYGLIHDQDGAKRFGVRLNKEFSYWAWRSCAIANIAMVLYSERKFKGTLYDLVCDTLSINGYAFKNRWGLVDVGWKHKSLCQILKSYGMYAQMFRTKNLRKIQFLIMEDKNVILSVRSKSGGHMILVKSIDHNSVIYNDPYCFGGAGGENVKEDLKTFKSKLIGKGIVTW